MHVIVSCGMWILDFLFPKTARAERTLHVTHFPLKVRTRLCGSYAIVSLLSYQDAVVRDAIQSAKFDADEHAQQVLARALDDFLIERALEASESSSERLLVLSVPLGKNRLQERGYNQVDAIVAKTRAVSGAFVTYHSNVLTRVRETEKQALLQKNARTQNVLGAFVCTAPETIQGKHVILIDDVVTTGSTMTEAARMLAPHAATVTLVALARAA